MEGGGLQKENKWVARLCICSHAYFVCVCEGGREERNTVVILKC